MSEAGNRPLVIKRRKVVSGGGHHGGAWKVAYADFVTAMMAFFLLMWLLNATTEQQRKGLADYFSPTIPINRISGGGDGAFGGESVFTTEALARSGSGDDNEKHRTANLAQASPGEPAAGTGSDGDIEALAAMELLLHALAGETENPDALLRHIRARLTDEGLVIELFDTAEAKLFAPESDVPTPLLESLAALVGEMAARAVNPLALAAHLPARPRALPNEPGWDLSTARAQATRRLLEASGLPLVRFHRVTGWSDRRPSEPDPMAPGNGRIEVILLRGS